MDYKSLSIEELVRECAQDPNSEAWIEFERRFKRLIGGVVIATCRKWGKNPLEFVEDLINDTYVKLLRNNCALLVRFKPQHENAFLGYLKAVAASVSHDFFRKIPRGEVEWDETSDPPDHRDPEAVEMMLFFDDVDRILRRRGNGVTERKERTIFWLYYGQRLTCKEIASIPAFKLSIKGIESVIHRLTQFVRRSLLEEGGQAATGT